jgi:hypothetical protein
MFFMKRLLTSLALTLAAGLVAMPAAGAKSQIKVTNCVPSRNVMVSGGWTPAYYPAGPYYWPSVYGYRYYQPRMATSNPALGIDYVNTSDKVMKQIEFGLIANGRLVAEVKDVGTFSPGAEIKHQFGVSPNIFPLQTSLVKCMPLKITYADGTKWQSHHLPALKHKLGLH